MTEPATSGRPDDSRRIPPRANDSAWDTGSWAMAIITLSVLIPAIEAIAGNEAFFAAHGIGIGAWIAAMAVITALVWLAVVGLLWLAFRLPAPAADLVVTTGMFLVAWFGAGNALARTIATAAPLAGWALGAVLGLAIAAAARTWRAGRALLACAAVAAIWPAATAAFNAQATPIATMAFDDRAERPSIAWAISDELQYPLVFDPNGRVRPQFPNLARLQQQATTYTHAYATANYTDFAVPAMMNGVTDVSAVTDTDRMRASLGFIPGLASKYAIVMESPIYSFACDDPSCITADETIQVEQESALDRLRVVLADTAAVTGRAMAQPYASMFPSLDGKWRDFWAGGDEFGSSAPGNTVDSVITRWKSATRTGVPTFTFWHSVRTHAPWAVDRTGEEIYPARLPVVPGAHMVGTNRTGLMRSAELASMERRLYANAAVDFDRQLGRLIDALKAAGTYDDTMIVVTADHGAGITFTGDRRVGDDLIQRWAEVAHVPLLIKAPGQSSPQVVEAPRSTGQIAATILATVGGTPSADLRLGPALDRDLTSGPVFSTVAGGKATGWPYREVADDPALQQDPWQPQDINPADPQHPFAIGIDASMIGRPVPDGWIASGATVTALPSKSDQVLLVARERSQACDAGASAGLVSAPDGTGAETVIGSLLWEDADREDGRWGWAIVPGSSSDTYRTWCPAQG